jgi:hypothetical protein
VKKNKTKQKNIQEIEESSMTQVRKGQTYQGDSYDSFFLKCFQEEKLLSGCKILGKSRIKIKINGIVKKIIIQA